MRTTWFSVGPLIAALLLAPHESARGALGQEPAAEPATDAVSEQDAAEVERLIQEVAQAEATEIVSEDAKLGQRARSILSAVEDFGGIRVEVEAGIVILSGRAAAQDASARAAALLEKLEGVVLVVDDVQVERGLGVRLAESWRGVVDQVRGLVAALPLLGMAAAIVLAFVLLGRRLRDAELPYRMWKERVLLQALLRQTVFAAVSVMGVVAALRFLDAGTLIGTILGAAGVLGIALGFAFRNIVENYLAGILIALRQPFAARDVVSIEGHAGTVLRTTTSETTLMDADGNHVRLPNSMIINGKVLNYTRNPLRRFTVSVGVGTLVDLESAQETGLETLRCMKGVIDDPDPSSRVAVLGDSSVTLEFFGWVDQRESSYAKVASEAHRLIKEAYDEAGIDMPPPAYALTFDAPPPELPAKMQGGGEPAPARAKAGPTPEAIDVSPESDIDEQVDRELALSDERNLLE